MPIPAGQKRNESVTWESSYLHSLFTTGMIPDSHVDAIRIVVGVGLCGFVSFVGIITNIINMVVFYKQGLNTTINISFFAMAVSDLGSAVFQQLCNVYINPLLWDLDLPIVYQELQYMTTAVVRAVFAKITFLLTVYVTAERCFCIVFPLHVKRMITPRRATIVIISFYVGMVFFVLPAHSASYFDWKFDPSKNRTLLGLMYRMEYDLYEAIVYLFQSIIGFLSFIAVVFFTCVLIHKLHRKKNWRKKASVDMAKSENMSNKDRATILMVVLIASVLIVCYLPAVLLSNVAMFEPEFTIRGRYKTLFSCLWVFGMLLENINSSVNIVFYYKMSTKYRLTFRHLFLKESV